MIVIRAKVMISIMVEGGAVVGRPGMTSVAATATTIIADSTADTVTVRRRQCHWQSDHAATATQ